MTTSLSEIASSKGIRYFLISFTDLFGIGRAKLVPAQAIDDMAANGAGFAGFATWLDMTKKMGYKPRPYRATLVKSCE
jgi:glutamate---methylamine ligase